MAAEALADIEGRMAILAEQLHTDATFGRMTGLGDEAAMDLLDVDAATLTVRQSVQLVGGCIIVGDVKTSWSRRRLDLDAGTVAVLRAHRRAEASERLLVGAGWRDHGLVLCAPDGSPLNPNTITQWFERTGDGRGSGNRPR
jgi:hypothetical protein